MLTLFHSLLTHHPWTASSHKYARSSCIHGAVIREGREKNGHLVSNRQCMNIITWFVSSEQWNHGVVLQSSWAWFTTQRNSLIRQDSYFSKQRIVDNCPVHLVNNFVFGTWIFNLNITTTRRWILPWPISFEFRLTESVSLHFVALKDWIRNVWMVARGVN
jgi:hypothetical protein